MKSHSKYSIQQLHAKMKKDNFNKKKVVFTNIKQYKDQIGLINNLNEMSLLFSYILSIKRPDLFKHTPYKVKLFTLVEKNQWTGGDYVAIEREDGSLDLHLAFHKLSALKCFPIYNLVWVLFHEFRHKIQLTDDKIKSVIDFPNWSTFKKYMKKQTGKNEDLINHIFHELNPAEIDANIFACEMTGIKFSGNAFNITSNSLKLLKN
ncbi:MAG: hypothetical protein AABY22_19705 [Nanoarchaeota archaeon]